MTRRFVNGAVKLKEMLTSPPGSEFCDYDLQTLYIHLNDEVMHHLLDIGDEDLRWQQQQQ